MTPIPKGQYLKRSQPIWLSALCICTLLATSAALAGDEICTGFGPQTPRDIDRKEGTNARVFSLAPDSSQLNLCNIHFHNHAEHKAADYALHASDGVDGPGVEGIGGGYQCNMSESLSDEELAPAGNVCHGMQPGDTVEFHWVYSSCDVAPGEGLGSCLSDTCANPNLRVEAQVFVLVNDGGVNLADFVETVTSEDGYHQPQALPNTTGDPVTFLGSTTGPKYTEQKCSPLQVSWSVRPLCAKLDISSLGRWCEGNVFNEDHAHGVRKLVTSPELLSSIE